MAKFKTLILLITVLTLVFLMTGCGMLFSRTAGPEQDPTGNEDDLPEWLLLSHLSDGSDVMAKNGEDDEDAVELEEDEERDEIEVAQAPDPAPRPASQPSAPAPEPAPAPAPSSSLRERTGMTRDTSLAEQAFLDQFGDEEMFYVHGPDGKPDPSVKPNPMTFAQYQKYLEDQARKEADREERPSQSFSDGAGGWAGTGGDWFNR